MSDPAALAPAARAQRMRWLAYTLVAHLPASHGRVALFARLLAAWPILGRIAQQQRADGTGPYWAAFCTRVGWRQTDPAAVQPAGPHDAPDCVSCRLLATVAVLALWLTLALPPPARRALSTRLDLARRKAAHSCCPGLRGASLML